MKTKKAYDEWSKYYDSNDNKTRDLEAFALRKNLKNIPFDSCLEVGSGTGKNTEWLVTKAKLITAVDFSNKMLIRAKERIHSDLIEFIEADISRDWGFTNKTYDLIVFSLILEHIKNLSDIFKKTSEVLTPVGYVYIGELHPYRQYSGSHAKFETNRGIQNLESFKHNLSDFTQAAKNWNFETVDINEYFDDNDRTKLPRILSILFRKK